MKELTFIILKEALHMTNFKHQNILECHGIFVEAEMVAIITELCDFNLETFIKLNQH